MAVTISNMSTNWSDGALHTAVKMNVTDTSSDAASLLMDLQVGAASLFSVTKTGIAVPKWVHWDGGVHNNNGFTVTNSTTLVDITSLGANVISGRTYGLQANMLIGVAGGGGVVFAISGTASFSFFQCAGWLVDSNTIKGQGNTGTKGGAVISLTTFGANSTAHMYGNFVPSSSGTLTVQMAQNTANASGVTMTWGNVIIQDVT